MNNFLLPIRYYAYSAFWIIAGCQTAHLIYRPMKVGDRFASKVTSNDIQLKFELRSELQF